MNTITPAVPHAAQKHIRTSFPVPEGSLLFPKPVVDETSTTEGGCILQRSASSILLGRSLPSLVVGDGEVEEVGGSHLINTFSERCSLLSSYPFQGHSYFQRRPPIKQRHEWLRIELQMLVGVISRERVSFSRLLRHMSGLVLIVGLSGFLEQRMRS